MARESKIYTTENHAYQVTKLAADREGLAALLRAQKLVNKISGGMESLVAELSEEELTYFCDLFAKYTKVINGDKKPVLASIFAVHFGGDWFEIMKWLAFCMGYNFGPFLVRLLRDGAEIKAAAVEGTGSPVDSAGDETQDEESTGSSGES
jgi:hypothetical protein